LEPTHIAYAVSHLLSGFITTSQPKPERAMPSKQFYPPDCPYIPIFDTLLEVVTELGPRQDTIITGDPGCMVRGQNHYNLLDVKTSLGASIGIAAGIASAFARHNEPKRVIALSGDSGFFHSNFQGLIDSVQTGAQMLILILDNNTTALSGGQPHPGTRSRDPNDFHTPVEIEGLMTQAGVKMVKIVDIDQNEDLRPAILAGLETDGVSVIIARGECPGCPEAK
jgi:indolepyruvate ferredoxin oxidoreductase alpha subunit